MIKPRECIERLPEYRSPSSGRTALNLDLNENAAGCSDAVLEKLRSLSSEELSRYPDRRISEAVVADWLGLTPTQVLLTNGIDEALQLIFWTYLGEDAELLTCEPTFPLYTQYAVGTGARVCAVRYRKDFQFSTDDFQSALSHSTRVIVIANPNNPTGTVISRSGLLSILKAAADRIVVIDEAYYDFYGHSLIDKLEEYPNLLVTRTFSKAYGLAGLRLGVIAGSTEVVEVLRRICSPFNVNAIALHCLPEALRDQGFVQDYVAQVVEGRKKLVDLCSALHIRTWSSYANFVLARIGRHCDRFVQGMRERGIALSDRSQDVDCEGCVRITVCTPRQMPAVLTALEECFRGLSE